MSIISTKALDPVYISEGVLSVTQKSQGIDYRMLSSCFTVTATMSDKTLRGAHFAHFGAETGGKSPSELLKAFSTSLQSAREKGTNVVEVQVIGNLDVWPPALLGLSTSALSLSSSSAQSELCSQLGIEGAKVVDTTDHDYVYLTISPKGSAQIKLPKDDDKSQK